MDHRNIDGVDSSKIMKMVTSIPQTNWLCKFLKVSHCCFVVVYVVMLCDDVLCEMRR